MYCIMSMLGTLDVSWVPDLVAHIMTACFFMPSIIVSMFLGSNGLGGPSPSVSFFWRYSPDDRLAAVAAEKARYWAGCRGESGADARRSCERFSARLRVSRDFQISN